MQRSMAVQKREPAAVEPNPDAAAAIRAGEIDLPSVRTTAGTGSGVRCDPSQRNSHLPSFSHRPPRGVGQDLERRPRRIGKRNRDQVPGLPLEQAVGGADPQRSSRIPVQTANVGTGRTGSRFGPSGAFRRELDDAGGAARPHASAGPKAQS